MTIRPPATFLRDYQLHGGYTPGPLLAAMAAVGAAGSLFVFARRRERPAPPGRGKPADRALAAGTLLATLSAVTIVLASDVFEFSWRYQLPALVTLRLAGVLGGTLIAARLRARYGRTPDEPVGPRAESLTPEDQATLVPLRP